MNVLEEIESKIESIRSIDDSHYLEIILIHIKRAEYYYTEGNRDEAFYNDVIYRCNQAYEGALKEAYQVLADKSQEEVAKKTPNNIEKYFEENKTFKDRVLQLFSNYRLEWRNKSTHDYKLTFDSGEAFIALMSVTSFIYLLLNEIQEKVAYKKQEKEIRDQHLISDKTREIIRNKDKTPVERLTELLNCFINLDLDKNSKPSLETGFELSGRLHAFLESVDNIEVEQEPYSDNNHIIFRPDFVVKIDNVSIILEIKKTNTSGDIVIGYLNQISGYMQAMDINEGIVFISTNNASRTDTDVQENVNTFNGREFKIITIVY
ncbi:hypothetical protein [uncultured Psychrobacter sp.]|uniref:hypothetical protein n=1 Tax=uncultured Psychrobacter sp. TaxID=259303 RepID=UPI00345A9F12